MRRILQLALLLVASHTAAQPAPISGAPFEVFQDTSLVSQGLVGSYVNASLSSYAPHDDWRVSQAVSGARLDASVAFDTDSWGARASVGIAGGSDSDWDQFSVQWDGFVQVTDPSTLLATLSDDGSRMWIDLNGDGSFASTGPEFINNNWGGLQATARGGVVGPIPPGVYRIRVQYYEEYFGSVMHLVSVPPPTVRVVYVIPSNRSAQPAAKANLEAHVLPLVRRWFCDQTERNGVGAIMPRFETSPSGALVAHILPVPERDTDLQPDPYGLTIDAAIRAGVVFDRDVIWLLIPEIHTMRPTGEIDGHVALGGGAAVMGANLLSLANARGLLDTRRYAGLTIPTIGPYPLVQDVSFPGFEGNTVSSLVSSWLGALAHEVSHSFGAQHDGRNDDNFHGNLMGNGLRGIRGALFPQHFKRDHARIGWGLARQFAVSPYFSPCSGGAPTAVRNPSAPSVSATIPGALTPSGGALSIPFTASSQDRLRLAILRVNGDDVDEVELSGAQANGSLTTTRFTVGASNRVEVIVFDKDGDAAISSANAVVAQAPVGPWPGFRIDPPQNAPGVSVRLIPDLTFDPDEPSSGLTYAWQLDAGTAFVPASSTPRSVLFATPGVRQIRLRVTDTAGNIAVSSPVPVRIAAACANGLDDDGDGAIDFPSDAGCSSAIENLEGPVCDDGIDNDGDGQVDWNGGPGGTPKDSNCSSPQGSAEGVTGPCGIGPELALIVPALAAWRLRRPLGC